MRRFTDITAADVGASHLRAFGRTWPVSGFIGRILPGDVGKRVDLVPTDDGTRGILQVENDEQRAARLGTGRGPKSPAERAAQRIAETFRVQRVGKRTVAAIIAEEYAPLVDFAKSMAAGECYCDEPEPGESG